ncbi:MAG: hypothetical protein ACK55Z_24760 [bacterium]
MATHLTPGANRRQRPGVRRGSSVCAPFCSLAPCPRAASPWRCLARGWLQTIQGSSGKPSNEACLCRRRGTEKTPEQKATLEQPPGL